MLSTLLLWVVTATATIAIIYALATLQWFVFFPDNNKVYVVTTWGGQVVSFISGDPDTVAKFDSTIRGWTIEKTPRKISYFERISGIKVFSFLPPPLRKLAMIPINYPVDLRSINPLAPTAHKPGQMSSGFDREHVYVADTKNAEFSGGLVSNLTFNIRIFLYRPDIAWRFRDAFLSNLSTLIDGAVKQFLLGINLLEFLGQDIVDVYEKDGKRTARYTKGDPDKARNIRIDLCTAVQKQEENFIRASGYKVDSIDYKDFEATEATQFILDSNRNLFRAHIKADQSEIDLITSINAAKMVAAKTREVGLAQAEVMAAQGKATAEGLEAQVKALDGANNLIRHEAARASQNWTTVVSGGAGMPIFLPPINPQDSNIPKPKGEPKKEDEQ